MNNRKFARGSLKGRILGLRDLNSNQSETCRVFVYSCKSQIENFVMNSNKKTQRRSCKCMHAPTPVVLHNIIKSAFLFLFFGNSPNMYVKCRIIVSVAFSHSVLWQQKHKNFKTIHFNIYLHARRQYWYIMFCIKILLFALSQRKWRDLIRVQGLIRFIIKACSTAGVRCDQKILTQALLWFA